MGTTSSSCGLVWAGQAWTLAVQGPSLGLDTGERKHSPAGGRGPRTPRGVHGGASMMDVALVGDVCSSPEGLKPGGCPRPQGDRGRSGQVGGGGLNPGTQMSGRWHTVLSEAPGYNGRSQTFEVDSPFVVKRLWFQRLSGVIVPVGESCHVFSLSLLGGCDGPTLRSRLSSVTHRGILDGARPTHFCIPTLNRRPGTQ